MNQVQAFLSINNNDIMILNETFLNSEVQIDDPRLNIDGYFLESCDYHGDFARGGICVSFTCNIPT